MASPKENLRDTQAIITIIFIIGKVLLLLPVLRYIFDYADPYFNFRNIISVIIGITIILLEQKRAFITKLLEKKLTWIRKLNFRKIITGCLISLTSFFLMISTLEIFAWFFFKKTTDQEFEMGSPIIQETEFIEALNEGAQLRQQNLDVINWDEYYLMTDFRGEYVNVINKQRYTTDQPEDYNHSIYMFGGSTMVGIEVGDSYTIPSYLQRKINEIYPNTYRVENMGVDAYSVDRQVNHLINGVNLSPGDIVIFYDGVNDGSYTYFCCVDDEDWKNEPGTGDSSLDSMLFNFVRFLEKNSQFYKHFIYSQKTLPQHLWSPKSRESIMRFMEEEYYNNLMFAHEYTVQNNAHFFHFLQPNLFTSDIHTQYEENFLLPLQPGGFGKCIELGYIALNEALGELEKVGVHNKDLTDILDLTGRPPNTEYYFDWCHVNHLAHQVIALNIFNEIYPYLEQQNK
jgi:hypothetical protein